MAGVAGVNLRQTFTHGERRVSKKGLATARCYVDVCSGAFCVISLQDHGASSDTVGGFCLWLCGGGATWKLERARERAIEPGKQRESLRQMGR